MTHPTWTKAATPALARPHWRWSDQAYFRLVTALYQRRAVASRSQFNERHP